MFTEGGEKAPGLCQLFLNTETTFLVILAYICIYPDNRLQEGRCTPQFKFFLSIHSTSVCTVFGHHDTKV
jgi:hypothetical protein